MPTLFHRLAPLLDGKARWQYALLVVMAVVSSLVQTIAIAALSLFFSALMGGPVPATVQPLIQRVGLFDLGIIVLALLLAGTSSSAFAAYWGIRSSWRLYSEISTRLLKSYLGERYEWHLTRNSSKLSSTVIQEVQYLVNGILEQLVMVITRGIEVVFVTSLLLLTRPLVALVAVLAFSVAYGVLFTVTRRVIDRQSRTALDYGALRFRTAGEALGAVKSVKISECEGYFLDRYRHSAERFGGATASIQYCSLLPKYAIEAILFGGLIGFVLVSHLRTWSIGETIPALALFGAAAIRLLPAAQQLYASLSMIRSSAPYLEGVLEGLGAHRPSRLSPALPPVHDGDLIALQGVVYQYPDTDAPSLHGVDLVIRQGEKIGIVGPTGSGKSTLVDVMLGLLEPQSGTLRRVGGHDGAWVEYVPQRLMLLDDTVEANVAFGVPDAQRDRQRIRDAVRRVSLEPVIESLPQGYQTVLGEHGVRLSGGQRQRIGLARALYRRPALLILDEASNALDVETERQVVETLLEQDIAMVVIAHRISLLRGCGRIVVMENGRIIAQGTYEDLLQNDQLFRRLADADRGLEAMA